MAILDFGKIIVSVDKFRQSSIFDALVERLDTIFRGERNFSDKDRFAEYPVTKVEKNWESESEKRNVIALVRVNHAGEISAQGLYLGQALFSRDQNNFRFLLKAASEERRHLAWCSRRLEELNGEESVFTPLWFLGSLSIGALVSIGGDSISLGFVEETERQVSQHLDGHLSKIPPHDKITRSVFAHMRQEELEHGKEADLLGGATLPLFAKKLMGIAALVMKETAQRL